MKVKLIGAVGEDVEGGEYIGWTGELKSVTDRGKDAYLFRDVTISCKRRVELPDGKFRIHTRLGNTYTFKQIV